MSLLVAAASTPTSPLERLKQIPFEFWWKVALGIGVLVAVIVLLRKIAKLNKFVLIVGVALVLSFVGFNWIYERNEPAWATPVVSWLAEFFPSRGRK